MSKIKLRHVPVSTRAMAKAKAARLASELVDVLALGPGGALGDSNPERWLNWAGCVLLTAADAIAARSDARRGDEH